jgi:hypothetical protein
MTRGTPAVLARTTPLLILALVLQASPAFAAPAKGGNDSKRAATLYSAGVKAFEEGEIRTAVDQLKMSLEIKPTAKAWLVLGNCYIKLGQLEDARTAFQKVLELDPRSRQRKTVEEHVKELELLVKTRLVIKTEPPGATVYIDLKAEGAKGKTPLTFPVLPGPHRVMLEMEGYESSTQEAMAIEGQDVEVSAPLKARTCVLTVSASPDSATIELDGSAPGPAPLTGQIAVGDHKVVVKAPNHETAERTVTCDPKLLAPIALAVALVNKAPPPREIVVKPTTGTVRVTSDPPGARVRCDNLTNAVTPFESTFVEGEHSCSFVKRGYQRFDGKISVKAGEVASLNADLKLNVFVADEYKRREIKVIDKGKGYILADAKGPISENEFIRRFNEQTHSSELDRRLEHREPALVGIGVFMTIISSGVLVAGSVMVATCADGNETTTINGTTTRLDLNACVSFDHLYNVGDPMANGVNNTVLGPWMFWTGLGSTAASLAMAIAGGVLADGTPGQHKIGRDAIDGYVLRHNRALLSNLLDAAATPAISRRETEPFYQRFAVTPMISPQMGGASVGFRW